MKIISKELVLTIDEAKNVIVMNDTKKFNLTTAFIAYCQLSSPKRLFLQTEKELQKTLEEFNTTIMS
jgi:hypothetical protein